MRRLRRRRRLHARHRLLERRLHQRGVPSAYLCWTPYATATRPGSIAAGRARGATPAAAATPEPTASAGSASTGHAKQPPATIRCVTATRPTWTAAARTAAATTGCSARSARTATAGVAITIAAPRGRDLRPLRHMDNRAGRQLGGANVPLEWRDGIARSGSHRPRRCIDSRLLTSAGLLGRQQPAPRASLSPSGGQATGCDTTVPAPATPPQGASKTSGAAATEATPTCGSCTPPRTRYPTTPGSLTTACAIRSGVSRRRATPPTNRSWSSTTPTGLRCLSCTSARLTISRGSTRTMHTKPGLIES